MFRLITAVWLIMAPGLALAQNVALVIGNASYRHVAPLSNPTNDAEAVSRALRFQGFEVVKATDLTRNALYNTLREFRAKADQAEIAMVYYAGHGIEIGGQNFLIPVDARLADERDADTEMIDVDVLLRQLSGASKLKMVVLDACRDNPFVARMERQNKSRNVGRGLAIVTTNEPATLIAYAAAAGEVTPDGESGKNSPFTRAFLNALDQPPADVRIILGAARDELAQTVPGAAPFVYSSLGRNEIVINPESRAPEPEPEPVVVAPEPAPEPEAARLDENEFLRDYAMAEFVNTTDAWDAFLDKYREHSGNMLYIVALRARKQLTAPTALAAAPDTVSRTPPPQPEAPASSPAAIAKPAPEDGARMPPRPADVAAAVPEPDRPATPSVVPDPPPAESGAEPETERLAALAPETATAPPEGNRALVLQPVPPRSVDDLTRDIQTFLKERACYTGAIDGIWGRGSRRGLDRFADQTGLDLAFPRGPESEELSDLLAMLETEAEADCPRPKAKTVSVPAKRTKPRATVPRQPTQVQVQPKPAPAPAPKKKRGNKPAPLSAQTCLNPGLRRYYDCD